MSQRVREALEAASRERYAESSRRTLAEALVACFVPLQRGLGPPTVAGERIGGLYVDDSNGAYYSFSPTGWKALLLTAVGNVDQPPVIVQGPGAPTPGIRALLYFDTLAKQLYAVTPEGWVPAAPPAGADVYVASDEPLTKGVVVESRGADVVGVASNLVRATRVIGVTLNAVASFSYVPVQAEGLARGVLEEAIAGSMYFLGPQNGELVAYGSLVPGARIIQIGIAKNPTDLELRIQDFGVL